MTKSRQPSCHITAKFDKLLATKFINICQGVANGMV